jgi:ELWxxDGT repeat protein
MWSMRNIILLGLVVLFIIILYACTIGRSANPENNAATFAQDLPAVNLTVQAQNATSTFNTVGQTINYVYTVTNNGSAALPGPVTITDDKTIVTCPGVNTVGNQNDNLDNAESLTCTSTYAITQADLNAGLVTNKAIATVGGVSSAQVSTTVQMTLAKVLELTGLANPTTYNQTAQTITFTYSLKNTGTATLGPGQFIINDDHIGAINCGGPESTLPPAQALTCTGTYTTTQNDLAVNALTFTANATGGGAANILPLSITVTNTSAPSNAPSNIARGSTIKHQVNDGEWMLQIARCYGADFTAVRNANPQVIDPDLIWPVTDVLTIPNVGSNGPIYGPPCVVYYTVLAGDTWESIAAKYNADLAVLKEANKDLAVAAGVKLKIPINSAGSNVPVTPSPQTQPIRITIPAGSTSVSVSGTVNPQAIARYVLSAAQGQTLTVKVTGTVNEVGLAVYSPTNAVLKPMDATLTWTGTIPANGDHFIEVGSLTGSNIKQFTLEVSLVTPPPPVTVTPSTSGSVERVADINAGAGDSSPAYLSVFNNILFFRADGNDGAGAELWKYDTTTKVASRVADTNPGAGGSDPAYLAAYNNALYFSANGNDGAGVELWRFNGSSTGRLTEINIGAGNSNPAYMTVFNNNLYFSATGNDGAGTELWRTDGTSVSRAADIYSGDGNSNPAYLTVFNNALYFSATSNDGAGTELWRYDGTAATRVSDINAGVGNSSPAYLTVFNNVLYFSANANDGSGVELWKYDGTNTARAADINAGAGDSAPAFLTVFNGALYFSANGNDGAGFELWKFDGTNATRVADINQTGDSFPSYLAVFNNELYFQANGGDGAGKELWKFKGP